MRIPSGSVLAVCAAAATLAAAPSWAQENDPLAYSIAVRQNACDNNRVEKAYFVESQRIAVVCEGDEAAALLPAGGGQVAALGAGALILLGAFASGQSGGNGSTGSTSSTNGTQ